MSYTQSMKTFTQLGISAPLTQALASHGITAPFPIQSLTIPVALKGADIIGQAKTGTGKTFGFGLPMLEKILQQLDPAQLAVKGSKPQGLIVVPTRELAKQVATDLRAAATQCQIRITEIYGGTSYDIQKRALAKGTEIVVGTPGRILDLQKRRSLHLHQIHTLVLDEADKMLELGFLDAVEKILQSTPSTRQTMLFSATMPGEIINMARSYMHTPTHIHAHDPAESTNTVTNIQQLVYRCHALNKIEVVARILQSTHQELCIIFTRTKRNASQVCSELRQRGFSAVALHGDLEQEAREKALQRFRTQKAKVLVTTDVVARGIDIDNVSHVINYHCPIDEKTYVHRIGRTGRAGKTGTAITFVDWEDLPYWSLINNRLELNIPQPVETYHTSPHLYQDLDIPTDVNGSITPPKTLNSSKTSLTAKTNRVKKTDDKTETKRPYRKQRKSTQNTTKQEILKPRTRVRKRRRIESE